MSEKDGQIQRPKELGLLIVISGPGGSGSTTISSMIAEKYNLSYFYAGRIFRDIAKEEGFTDFKEFLKQVEESKSKNYDLEIDNRMIQLSQKKDMLIEGKTFAALATIKNIPCTLKVWIDADLKTRIMRTLSRDGILEYGESLREDLKDEYERIKEDLIGRFEIQKKRFKYLYGIEYDKQELYNDMVIDSSNQGVEETFNLICKEIDRRMEKVTNSDNKNTNSILNGDFAINWKRWKCLVCGYLFEGTDIQKKCPKCGNEDPEKFEDVD